MDAELKNAPTLKDIREQNTENILRSLLRSRELARNVLASENQISIMTVKHIVDDLLAAGLVVDISYGFIDPRIRMGSKK